MTDGSPSSAPQTSTPLPQPVVVSDAASALSPQPSQNRDDLLQRARSFLVSPQIAQQDTAEKRKFLVGRGLNDSEIERLLRELPPPKPVVPPRSYPQPPPSNLPTLLLGIFRLFSWITGGSAVLVFIYRRFLLPRVIHTTMARRSLQSHHLSLLRRLNDSLASLKESQTETYRILPRPDPYKEPSEYEKCTSIEAVLALLDKETSLVDKVPPITLLRCGLADFGKGKEGESANPTTAEFFQHLENAIPWLASEEAIQYEEKLWETLSTCPLFRGTSSSSSTDVPTESNASSTRWTFISQDPPEPPLVMKSYAALANVMPKKPPTTQSPAQHTLQTLSDFTGYLSTQIYIPYRTTSSMGGYFNSGNALSPAEDEFKREIRALKGLVLNRRSFMPTASPSIPTP